MKFSRISSFALLALLLSAATALAQPQSLEVSETDGIPVLIKHLPEWEKVRDRAVFATNAGELKAVLGERPVLDLIDFSVGTEAVTAPYDAGRLLIVEYVSPQGSSEADALFSKAVSGDDTTEYRRIGNYNVFVFDVTDAVAANLLLDQVQYEKDVQWLGANPFEINAERAFILRMADVFVSTVLWILLGIGVAVAGGAIAGLMYFRRSDKRRAAMTTFSDAGGMTRLNLDGFTPDADRLLK
jgi:hypothetical protein